MTNPYDDYFHGKVVELKELMNATDVVCDLTGVTLTINELPLFIHQRAIRHMLALLNRCEELIIDEARARQEDDRKEAAKRPHREA